MRTCARCRLDADAAASRLVAAALVALACSTVPGAAEPSFYAGKQITLIAGSGVGGGYDLLARLAARHLGRLIPGHPTIVVQNMPAAGSLVATNQIYNSAPKDGTVIALIQRGMLLAKLSNPSGVRFELEKLNWLGNLNSETGLVLAWHTAPHRRAQDLFERELIVGGQTGVDPEITPRLYNSLIGTKFKIVTGYNGTAEIALAIERGEVQGIGDWSWASLKKQRPDWLRDKKVTLLIQGALQRDPDLPDLPSALDFVKSDADRKVMELFFTQKTIARPVIAPPGVPGGAARCSADRVRGARRGCAVSGRRGKIQSGGRADRGRSRRQGRRPDHRHAGRRSRSLCKGHCFAGAIAVKDSTREVPQ